MNAKTSIFQRQIWAICTPIFTRTLFLLLREEERQLDEISGGLIGRDAETALRRQLSQLSDGAVLGKASQLDEISDGVFGHNAVRQLDEISDGLVGEEE